MSETTSDLSRAVLVTGAAGYIGRQVIAALRADRGDCATVVAMDVRPVPEAERAPGIRYVAGDVRDPGLRDILREHAIDTVVHLAAIVTPGKGAPPDLEYSVDVLGTQNVLEACVAGGVGKLIYTSSGAAYGYHADSPPWLRETDPLRGNDAFAYSRHKRLVEEMLARYRSEHPGLRQLVLRPGTILGETVANQITALFDKPVLLGVSGSATPYVFIWDQDVVACVLKGLREDRSGIYNLAGDGVMTLKQIAERIGKPYVPVPAFVLRGALGILHALGLTQYGPEQIDFLRYRPVLANDRLKTEFGYTPRLTTAEVFDLYWRSKTGG